jgi:Asp-tRNA(Asn)/Glu-tRNA(Gln) amidotransferase A subunit family amidase
VDADPDAFSSDIVQSVEYGRAIPRAEVDRLHTELDGARTRLAARFASVSAVVCPTVPGPVPDRDPGPEVEPATRFTRDFNALGWAALSLPAGMDSGGRPVGLQFAAPPSARLSVLDLAAVAERAFADAGVAPGV